MTDATISGRDEDAAFAGEYALGLLSGEDLATAEIRVQRDDGFAALVRGWHETLAPLAMAEPEDVPSPATKAALMARLFAEPKGRAFSLMSWLEAATLVLGGLAIATYFSISAPQDTNPSFTAKMQPEQRDFLLSAAVILGEAPQIVFMRAGGSAAPAGRATEVWAIVPDQAPVSLGLVPDDMQWAIPLPAPLAAQAALLTLALSDEPLGGSPTGIPTGEVLAAATVRSP